MKNENITNINDEIEIVAENEPTESKLSAVKAGVPAFFKKHGKKVAAGAAIVGAMILGAVIGSKAKGSNDGYESDETDWIDTDATEVDTDDETTEEI